MMLSTPDANQAVLSEVWFRIMRSSLSLCAVVVATVSAVDCRSERENSAPSPVVDSAPSKRVAPQLKPDLPLDLKPDAQADRENAPAPELKSKSEIAPAPVPKSKPPAADVCATLPPIATLFPASRCCEDRLAEQLTATTWVMHRSGPNYDSDTRHYREVRVVFSAGDAPGALEVTVDRRRGTLEPGDAAVSTAWLRDASVVDEHWAQDDVTTETLRCSYCGELLECGGKLTTIKFFNGWLHFQDPVALSETTLYLAQKRQEIVITLPKDAPRTGSGDASFEVSALGSDVVERRTGTYKSTATEIFRWTNNADRFIRQGRPSRPGYDVRVESERGGISLEHDAVLGWGRALTGAYDFPLPVLLRDLADYPAPLHLPGSAREE